MYVQSVEQLKLDGASATGGGQGKARKF